MEKLIAYCGLDCKKCDARTATLNDDYKLREKTAKLWSKLNDAPITADMINCMGCCTDGVKTPYCNSLCPIRKCAQERSVKTCGDCPEFKKCPTVGTVISSTPEALENLGLSSGSA